MHVHRAARFYHRCCYDRVEEAVLNGPKKPDPAQKKKRDKMLANSQSARSKAGGFMAGADFGGAGASEKQRQQQ